MADKRAVQCGNQMLDCDFRQTDRQTVTDRDALTFYCLQLTSPQDKGVQNMINFPSRTATCKNHVVLSKGISSMDNKDESSASAKYSALPAEIFTFNPSHLTDSFTCT